jgi:hypothetical protein
MTTGLSVAAWVRPTGTGSDPTQGGILVNKEGEYELARFADGLLYVAVANANPSWSWISTGVTMPLNGWTHIAFTYSSVDQMYLAYLNGRQAFYFPATGPIGDNHPGIDQLWIGGRALVNQFFAGDLDQVRVVNRALSGLEIGVIGAAP